MIGVTWGLPTVIQAWFLKTRGQHMEAKAKHLEAKHMRAAVLGPRHLEVALSLQQAAISMVVGTNVLFPTQSHHHYKFKTVKAIWL